jgi:hypothetical protein
MDATKAELESRIRTKRARLDDKLARLGARFDHAKHTSKMVGMITAGVVIAMAVVGATAILVRSIIARRRRPHGIAFFPR